MALEEKQISYDCVLINLRDKPAWYKRKVPTTLVPAAVIKDSSGKSTLISESLDILKVGSAELPWEPLLGPPLQESQLVVCSCRSWKSSSQSGPCFQRMRPNVRKPCRYVALILSVKPCCFDASIPQVQARFGLVGRCC